MQKGAQIAEIALYAVFTRGDRVDIMIGSDNRCACLAFVEPPAENTAVFDLRYNLAIGGVID